jgi:predicted acyl esterase/lysophospholipase L1-like esterase
MSIGRWFLLLVALTVGSHVAAAPPAVDLGGVTEKHVMVPMRDGKKLSMYLYFPAGKGPWPAVYEQRYADLRGAPTRKAFAHLASAGYVVAAENFRGTYLSEGAWVGYRALGWGEKQDGFDTVEWLARQPWCTGKVGTFGSSQAGFAQNFLAVTQPPHLACQYMIDTGLSLYHEGYRIGGTTRPERFKQMDAVCRDPQDNRRLLREWFAHPTYDAYWADEDCTRHFDRMNVPCFTVGSWYDFMCVGSIESFIGRQHRGGPNSRGTQQLLLGPWLHGRFKDINKVGELTYPENARFPMEAHMVRWLDHYLKGIDNGVEREPTVRYYTMGAAGEPGAPGNEWRTARNWPVPAQSVSYYLHEGGKLDTKAPAEEKSSTSFAADPLHPNEIPGRAFPGARDARPFEKQSQVRTFTSEVLAEPVEWTGKVRAELYVSSTAKDTDFIVRVSDVYPDGRSILVMDYIRRARYRESYEKEVFMKPGEVYKVAFDVGWTSQVFNRGHRIRITVASTGAPFFEPNPNTGEPLTLEPPSQTVIARNTVYHDRRHASRILAPLRPAASVKIITLGDSITKGVRPGVKSEETFAFLLQERLRKEGVEASVVNVGVGGERTDQALQRLSKAVIALNPRVVTIMYGTNDSWVDKDKKDSRLSPEAYGANLRRLVADLRKADIEPVLMTEPRLGDRHGRNGAGEHPNQRLEAYVRICRAVARETKTPLVDHFEHWSKRNAAGMDIGAWTTDQCHPNPRGHEEMAQTMLPVVLQVLRAGKDR